MDGNRVKVPRISWILVLTVAVVSVLSALYVGLTPTADQTELQRRTWEQFASQDPEVARIYSMDLALLGMSIGAFAVLAVVVAAIPYRRGEPWAWYALWVVPLLWGGVAARMFIDEYPAGSVYAVLAAIVAVGLLIPIRRVRTRA
jgi:alkylation response protein AidB-like acyl-CoA dehydrogenase